jgi:hypothetical protein
VAIAAQRSASDQLETKSRQVCNIPPLPNRAGKRLRNRISRAFEKCVMKSWAMECPDGEFRDSISDLPGHQFGKYMQLEAENPSICIPVPNRRLGCKADR